MEMRQNLEKTVSKKPISFDLYNRVSGRPRIEKKINRKKKYTAGLWSETFLFTFATRNVSEKNVLTYENRSEGDFLHARVELSLTDTVTLTCYKSGLKLWNNILDLHNSSVAIWRFRQEDCHFGRFDATLGNLWEWWWGRSCKRQMMNVANTKVM